MNLCDNSVAVRLPTSFFKKLVFLSSMCFFGFQGLPQHRRVSTSSICPKTGLSSFGLFLLFLLPCILPQKASADAVIINFPAFFGGSSEFRSSSADGSPSEGSFSGNLIRIGAFSDNPTALIGGLTAITSPSAILANLESKFTQYTSFTFSDTLLSPDSPIYPATDPDTGAPLVAQPSIGAGLRGKDIYLLFYNAATTGAANQMAIFRMKDASMNGPTGSDLAGIFSTATGADTQYTSYFNLSTSEADMLLGQYVSSSDTFVLGKLSGGVGQITSATTLTMNAGATPRTYQILSNNGADTYALTSKPSWASIDEDTGIITLSPASNISGSFTLTFSANNSVTASTATGSLAVTVVAPPDITSTLTATANRGSAFIYQISADSSPTSFNATGLPGGLSINTSNGLISGTPNVAAGTFNVTLSATNTAGTGTATLVLTLRAAPVITSTLTATATRGTAFTYQIAADSSPTSFNATGLPGGLSINTSTGQISGTPNVAAATFNVTISATNTTGTGTATLVLTLRAAPVITSTLTAIATRGTAFTYQIAADSSPTSFNAIGLPGGLSINTSNGLISGTPNVAAGTFNVTISATNSTGTGTAILVITLNAAPVITSTLTASATRGSAFIYQIVADSSPTSFNAIGLPGGLSINTGTGQISGTPNVAAGTFNVTLSAANSTGTGTATLTINLSEPIAGAPVITSSLTATATRGTAFTYPIIANSSPTSYNATGLPGGLSINTTSGLISGTPNVAAGTFNVTLSATNSTGTGTATLVITLKALPVITSTLTATATRGTAFTYQISANSSPTSFNATGLPGGLSINTRTGVISGTPNVAAGTFNVTLSATNSTGTGTATLVLDLTSPSLSIPSLISNRLTRTAGTAYSIPVTIPRGFVVDSSTLEPTISGVSYSSGNLLISSTAAPFAKGITKESLTLTLRRTSGMNGATISAFLTFDLRLEAPTPRLLTSRGPFEVTVGEDYSLQLLTDVSAICPNQNIAIIGTLPSDLVNYKDGGRDTGLITGKNTSTTLPYEFTVNVVAQTSTKYEGGGALTVPVIFRLRNPIAPVITSETSRIAGAGKAIAQYTIKASGSPLRFNATGLPPGLVLDGANIKGTPNQAGNYDVRIEAYNSYRPGSTLTTDLQSGTATLRIFVSASKPPVAVPLSGANNLQVGNAASFSMLSAQELGLRISGYGFPPGLSINSSTGMVSGTPTTAGTYSVTIFIQNGKGWLKKAVSLTVR